MKEGSVRILVDSVKFKMPCESHLLAHSYKKVQMNQSGMTNQPIKSTNLKAVNIMDKTHPEIQGSNYEK